MSKKILKAATIGLRHGHMGSIGPSKPGWIHTARAMDGIEIVAYAEDTDPSGLEDASTYYPDANVYTDYDELIDKEDFDIAFMALPAVEIPVVGAKLAKAGKHFMMEKQFARRATDLAELTRVVRDNGVTVFPAYPHRFNPVAQDIKKLIDDGIFGKPLDIEVRMITGQVRPGGRDPSGFMYTNKEEGGGIQHMLGGHYLEVVRFLMDCEVKSVQAMNGRPVGIIDEPLEDLSIAVFEFENGAYGSMHSGYLQRVGGGYDTALVYRGELGEANWTPIGGDKLEVRSAHPSWSGAPVKTYNYEIPAAPAPGYAADQWMFDMVQSFVDAVRNGTESPLTIEDSLHTLQLIDAMYESGREGKRIDIKYGV